MLPENFALPLTLFVALWLALSLFGLTASGHFPAEHRAAALRSTAGALILFGSIAAVSLCLVAASAFAWRLLPWYAAIIGGGAAMLAAPLLLRSFPNAFVNGRSGLIVLAGACALLALAMIWVTAVSSR